MPWQGAAARAAGEQRVRGGISLELLVHRAAQGMHMQCTDLSIREVFGCSGLAGDNRTSMVPVALGSEVVSGEGPTVRL